MPVSCRQGFTLIELSIVLVIIGLLVGGILVGQDLIKAATVRAQIAQIEKYNTAVNTFRLKYGGMPGDFAAEKTALFGMANAGGGGCGGDGNGLLCPCDADDSITTFGCENGLIWSHLSYANLIDGSFTAIDSNPQPNVTALNVNQYLPRAKISNAIVHAFGVSRSFMADYGSNFWFVGGLTNVDHTAMIITLGLAPSDLFAIDTKMDDGFPMTGKVVSREDADTNTPSTPDAAGCVSTATGNPYNTLPEYANQLLCNARFNM